MTPDSLKKFILDGIDAGTSITELKHAAAEQLGTTSEEFDHAYDLIVLGEQAPVVQVPNFSVPQVQAAPEPVSTDSQLEQNIVAPVVMQQVEPAVQTQTTAPAVIKRGGFFNWFKVHKLAVSVLVLVSALTGGGYVAANMFMAPNVNDVRALIFEQLQEMDTVQYQGSVEGEVTTDAAISLESFLKHNPLETIASLTSGRVAGSQSTKVRVD
jgi:hypothetical protein